jgi:hypothetical protein
LWRTLERDTQDLGTLPSSQWLVFGDEREETPQRRQPAISSGRAAPSFLFDMLQEGENTAFR